MKVYRIENFKKGWFYGDFTPSVDQSPYTEVGFLEFKAGDHSLPHYHRHAVEYNLIVQGKMRVNDIVFGEGDIFVLGKYETAGADFLEDTKIVCVKSPSVPGDKFYEKTDGQN